MLSWMNKLLFTENNFLPRFIKPRIFDILDKTGKLQVFALHLPKCLCLEYALYKNPPKECRQGINYPINQTIILCNIMIGY